MKFICTLGVCVLAAGCSGLQAPARTPEADAIAVYEDAPPGSRPYRLVKRVWVERWRSAFNVPAYASVEAGRADMQAWAVALGGNAVMNFGCYRIDPNIPTASKPELYCNGNVIKYQ